MLADIIRRINNNQMNTQWLYKSGGEGYDNWIVEAISNGSSSSKTLVDGAIQHQVSQGSSGQPANGRIYLTSDVSSWDLILVDFYWPAQIAQFSAHIVAPTLKGTYFPRTPQTAGRAWVGADISAETGTLEVGINHTSGQWDSFASSTIRIYNAVLVKL